MYFLESWLRLTHSSLLFRNLIHGLGDLVDSCGCCYSAFLCIPENSLHIPLRNLSSNNHSYRPWPSGTEKGRLNDISSLSHPFYPSLLLGTYKPMSCIGRCFYRLHMNMDIIGGPRLTYGVHSTGNSSEDNIGQSMDNGHWHTKTLASYI